MHSYDYLEIVVKDGRMDSKYCGNRTGENIFVTGENIFVTGDQVLITFHSGTAFIQKRGFLIHFTAGPHGKCFS